VIRRTLSTHRHRLVQLVHVESVPNLTVDAAILPERLDYLPNWASVGYERTLTIFGVNRTELPGARFTVNGATVVTGYAKDYIYDTSLQDAVAAVLRTPNSAVWSPTSYEECLAETTSRTQQPEC